MQQAQNGVFIEETGHHRFLEFTAASNGLDGLAQKLKPLLGAMSSADPGLPHVVFGFGHALSNRLFSDHIPDDLADFEDMGDPSTAQYAPSTQADLLIWIHGPAEDLVFDRALELTGELDDAAELSLDVRGFKYHGNRDLIDFEDGTANPKTDEEKGAAAQNSDGGSILLTQKWVHDLKAFKELSVPEQEKIIGRTKVDNIEFEGDEMPETSHISRTDVSVDGIAQKIYRRSMPFGDMEEKGLYFVAFACHRARLDVQLRRMYGLTGDGLKDALTGYSKAASSSYWYVPPVDALHYPI